MLLKNIKLKPTNQCQLKYEMSLNNYTTLVAASPKVRKFARELGIDVNKVLGSERKGRVTEKDIKLFILNKSNQKEKNDKINKEDNTLEYPHKEFGEIEIKDIPRVKKLSSKYLINSWSKIPHVTNHDEADITEMEEFRNSLKDIYTGEKKKNNTFSFNNKGLNFILKKISKF